MSADLSLCPELDPLLASELAAGNSVRYVERATTREGARLAMLASPFRAVQAPAGGVERIDVADPHWWDVEYRCARHGHQLVCPSGPVG